MSDAPPERPEESSGTPEREPEETPRPEPEATPAPASAAADSPPRPAPPLRRWRRRLKWAALAVLALVLILRLLLPHLIAPIVDSAVSGLGWRCEIDDVTLVALRGKLEIRGVHLRSGDDDEAFADLAYVHADVHLGSLLLGKVRLQRVAVVGLDLVAERGETGGWAFLADLPPGEKGDDADDEDAGEDGSEEDEGEPEPLDLRLPVRIDSLDVQDIRLRLRDRGVRPPVETEANLAVHVADLGHPGRPGRLDVAVSGEGVLDALKLVAEVRAAESALDATVRVKIHGAHPVGLAGYLEAIGIVPRAQELDLAATAGVALRVDETDPSRLKGDVSLDGLTLRADGAVTAGVRKGAIEIADLGAGGLVIGEVEIEGVEARAARTPEGALRIAGLDLVGTPDAGEEEEPDAPEDDDEAGSPFAFELRSFRVIDGRAGFVDEAVEPAVRQEVLLEELFIGDLAVRDGALLGPAELRVGASAPGLATLLRLAAGRTHAAGAESIAWDLELDGVAPVAAGPYLAALGLESLLESGKVECKGDATVARDGDDLVIGASIAPFRVVDGESELLAIASLRVDDARANLGTLALKLPTIALDGPAVSAVREGDGALRAVGFRLRPAGGGPAAGGQADPAAPTAPGASGASGAPAGGEGGDASAEAPPPEVPPEEPGPVDDDTPRVGPSIEIGRFVAKRGRVTLRDETIEPAIVLDVGDLGFEVSDARLEPDGDVKVGARLSLSLADFADQLALDASATLEKGVLRSEVSLVGEGLRLAGLRTHLALARLEPLWEAARLEATSAATVDLSGEGVGVDAEVRDVSLVEGEREWLGLTRAAITGGRFGPAGIDLGTIEFDSPRVRWERDETGAFVAFGIRVAPGLDATETAPDGGAEATDAEPGRREAETPGEAAGPATAPGEDAGLVLDLRKFIVREAALHWLDRSVEPPIEARPHGDLDIVGLALGRPSEPATFDLGAAIPGGADRVGIRGTVDASRETKRVDGELIAEGLRSGPYGEYLPEGLRLVTQAGTFRTGFRAALLPSPEGGVGVDAGLADLKLSEGEGRTLLALKSLGALWPRLDAAAGVLAGERVVLEGLEVDVRRTPAGALQLAGVELGGAGEEASSEVPGERKQDGAGGEGDDAGKTAAPPPAAGAEKPATSALTPEPLPLITLEKLDLGVSRVTFTDESVPERPPVTVRDLRLDSREPIRLFGEEPAKEPPVKLHLVGVVDPVVDSLDADFLLAPFAARPRLEVQLDARGIRGEQVNRVVPEIGEKIDASSLVVGSFEGRLGLTLGNAPAHPTQLSFLPLENATIFVENTRLRGGAEAEVLAGVDDLDVEVERIDPAKRSYLIRSVDVVKPMGRVRQIEGGVHVAGITILTPPEPEEGEAGPGEGGRGPGPGKSARRNGKDSPSQDPKGGVSDDFVVTPPPGPLQEPPPPGAPPPGGAPAPPPAKPASKPAEEPAAPPTTLVIERLAVSGIDFAYEDMTTSPPTRVPLTGLDVEVEGLRQPMSPSSEPMRFQVFADAGKVPLPRRKQSGGLLGPRTATPPTAEGLPEGFEMRRLFDEVSVKGSLLLAQPLVGRVGVEVFGMELGNFKRIAAKNKITIEDGIADSKVKLDFGKDGTLGIDTETTFINLDVTEKGGVVERILKLPAPLGAVIFILRDKDGAVRIPLSLDVGQDGVSLAQITGKAITVLSTLIAEAVAKSPIRVVSGAAGVIGLDLSGGDEPLKWADLEFEVADAGWQSNHPYVLQPLLNQLDAADDLVLELRHVLGTRDVARLRELANPSPADSKELMQTSLQRRRELKRRHTELLGLARHAYLSRLDAEAERYRQELVAVEESLHFVEQSLDDLSEQLEEGAERQRERRTRQACVGLGAVRLRVVREWLADQGVYRKGDRLVILPSRYQVGEREKGVVQARLRKRSSR